MAQDTVYVASTTPGPNLTPVTSDITLANAVVAASAARDAAQASQTAAAASATTASTKAGEASASATAADGSKTAAAASASLSQSYATGFSIGTVVTLAPGSSATASITGLPGAQTLNLGLPQGAAGVGDMLKADNLSGLGNTTTARGNLGLGTAATKDIGTSGNNVPLLDGANTWSAEQKIEAHGLDWALLRMNADVGARSLILFEEASVSKWQIFRSSDNSLFIFDNTANAPALIIEPNGYMHLNATGGDLLLKRSGTERARVTGSGFALPASHYLNWGATYDASGYGLRDNGGVIEAKNSGGAWAPIPTGLSVNFTTRQTVAAGPVDASGFPSFLPATSGSLSITTQNVSASTPLIVTAAQGFDASGKIDHAANFTGNQTWNLSANATSYLYINAQTGALGVTNLAPVYQHGGTPSTTNGQFTFNVSEMRGYLGNGSTAPATPIVFIGEVVTGTSSVTSAVAYAYNGRYDSGWTSTLPAGGSAVSRNHNLGVNPYDARFSIECITAEFGWSVGDQIVQPVWQVSGYGVAVTSTRNAVKLTPNSTYPTPTLVRADTGNGASLTAANWKYKFVVSRGW